MNLREFSSRYGCADDALANASAQGDDYVLCERCEGRLHSDDAEFFHRNWYHPKCFREYCEENDIKITNK